MSDEVLDLREVRKKRNKMTAREKLVVIVENIERCKRVIAKLEAEKKLCEAILAEGEKSET